MKGMIFHVCALVVASLVFCSCVDLDNSGNILILILGLVTMSRCRVFKDPNSPNVILIVDEFRKLRSNFRWEALNNGRKTRKDIWGRYSLARD